MEPMIVAQETPGRGSNVLYVNQPVIRTYTGHYLNVFEPDPDKIDINDIAHALSMNCRWTGHCPFFWSVAHHSMLVMSLVEPEHRLEALMHDATEAYIHDFATPIKQGMPEYKQLESSLEAIIFQKFLGKTKLSDAVKIADRRALEAEWNYFYGDKGRDKRASLIIDGSRGSSMSSSERAFKARFYYYKNLHNG